MKRDKLVLGSVAIAVFAVFLMSIVVFVDSLRHRNTVQIRLLGVALGDDLDGLFDKLPGIRRDDELVPAFTYVSSNGCDCQMTIMTERGRVTELAIACRVTSAGEVRDACNSCASPAISTWCSVERGYRGDAGDRNAPSEPPSKETPMCFASRIDSEHDIVMVLQMAEAHTYTLRILMLPLIEGRLTRYHHETFLSRQGTVMSNDEVYQTLENRMR